MTPKIVIETKFGVDIIPGSTDIQQMANQFHIPIIEETEDDKTEETQRAKVHSLRDRLEQFGTQAARNIYSQEKV